jgi:hypothetical protein
MDTVLGAVLFRYRATIFITNPFRDELYLFIGQPGKKGEGMIARLPKPA